MNTPAYPTIFGRLVRQLKQIHGQEVLVGVIFLGLSLMYFKPYLVDTGRRLPDDYDGILISTILYRVDANILAGRDVFDGGFYYPYESTLTYSDLFLTLSAWFSRLNLQASFLPPLLVILPLLWVSIGRRPLKQKLFHLLGLSVFLPANAWVHHLVLAFPALIIHLRRTTTVILVWLLLLFHVPTPHKDSSFDITLTTIHYALIYFALIHISQSKS